METAQPSAVDMDLDDQQLTIEDEDLNFDASESNLCVQTAKPEMDKATILKDLLAVGITTSILKLKTIHKRTFIQIVFESPEMMEYATDNIPHLGTHDTWEATVSKLLMRRVLMTGIPIPHDYTDKTIYNLLQGLVNVMDITLTPPKNKNSRRVAKILLGDNTEVHKLCLLQTITLNAFGQIGIFHQTTQSPQESIVLSTHKTLNELQLWRALKNKYTHAGKIWSIIISKHSTTVSAIYIYKFYRN